MCGIAGIVKYGDAAAAPVDLHELRRMRDAMATRGPDGAGEWLSDDGSVALAHRRLAIIDLDARAGQPMTSADGVLTIVFNGEIYNYRELRRELQREGAVFRTESDTEVLLHLYRSRGENMVERLRGMFAFGIWDARSQSLFLARDPFGIKPLYFADDGNTFRFASQVKALAAGGALSNEPSAAGVAGFFVWGHVPEPWTWLADVKALPAGSTLTIRRGARIPEARPYFDLRREILAAQDSPPADMDAVRETLVAVEDSVRHHLVADVPVGLFLSAGRDSTLLGTLAARHVTEPLRTITLGFDEYRGTSQDEAPVAEAVAEQLGSRHETKRIRRQDFEADCERILAAMDQPSIDGVNTWLVSRAAAQAGLKVALSGLGGDELFGGYPSFWQVPRLVRRLRLLSWLPALGRAFRVASAPIIGRLTNPKWAGLFEYGTTVEGAWLLRRALFMPWELPQLIDPERARSGLRELALQDDLRSRIAGIHKPQFAVMALEMSGYMRNQLLRDADWAGMAHSVEIRVPLVDVELLRRWLPHAAHRLPVDRQRLLDAADPAIAATVGIRAKSGFAVPVAQWLTAEMKSMPHARGLRPWARQVATAFGLRSASLRIGALLTDAYGGVGGIAKFNRDLLAALVRMPEVHAVVALPRVIQRQPEPAPDKVRFDFEAARGKHSYVLRAIRLAFSARRLDLLICGHLNLLPLAWLVSRAQRCSLLLIVHGIEAWEPHRNPFVRALLARTDIIAAVSRYTVERMKAWSGVSERPFRILPNCVDLERFAPRPRNAALSRRYGLGGRRVLLTVGRLAGHERYKGFDEVLEVLPRLAQELPEVVYVIVGDGDDRGRLQAKAHALGVAERVVFTGFVSEEEKVDLYNLADVYVMPSRGEGFGIVYLEAMACGAPTIGSRLDGSRDALRDGKLGQLVDPRDPQELLQAIRNALGTPRGRPAGLEFFSDRAYRDRVADLVRDVLRASA
jgi:asparagine synthase (glutamine-hydrolysing)